MRLISNPERMLELTGWSCRVSLEEGLARTRDWVAANERRFRTDHYVI